MKIFVRPPAALALLTTPLLVYAQPHIITYEIIVPAFGGGAVGGFLGALLACWFCNRKRGANGDDGSKRY